MLDGNELVSDCAPCLSNFEDGNLLSGVCIQPTVGASAYIFMMLIESLIKSQCQISEPCKRVQSPKDASFYDLGNESFDFIVVGAGSAGVVVASRLSENPNYKVLLLEAGGEEPTTASIPVFTFNALKTNYDWQYKTAKQERACLANGGHCPWPRGKMICGTACLSGHMYSRGSPKVYDIWGANNTGWKFQDLLPYFKKSEKNMEDSDEIDKEYHGFDGPMAVSRLPFVPDLTLNILAGAHEMGAPITSDINGRTQEGFTVASIMSEDGVMVSPSKAFLRPAMDRKNLRVLIHAHATKIFFDESGTRATGIEFYDRWGNRHTANATKEVILSGGVVGSPQLLMVSGVGPKAHLEDHGIKVVRDLPVGGNLHYHVGLTIGMRVAGANNNSITSDSLQDFLDFRSGPLTSNGLTQVTAFIASKYAEKGVPDTQVFFDGYLGKCRSRNERHEHSRIFFRPIYLLSKCRGSIKLHSANPFDNPHIDPNYLCDPKEVDVLLEAVNMLRNLSNTEAMRAVVVKWDIEKNEKCKHLKVNNTDETDYWRCVIREYTNGENHHSGTCKMGPANDPAAVVDHELKVHGFTNLRVADGAIFPTPINCNPIAPTIMVGEKAADLILQKWATEVM